MARRKPKRAETASERELRREYYSKAVVVKRTILAKSPKTGQLVETEVLVTVYPPNDGTVGADQVLKATRDGSKRGKM